MPPLSSLERKEFSTRGKSQDKGLQHGGILTGDSKISSRTIGVEVIIMGENQLDYQSQVDELMRYAYRRDQRLYVTDTRYVNVACLTKYQENYYKGYYGERGTIDLTFLALDPFFYENTQIFEQIITSSPAKFTINNPTNIDSPVTVTIVPTEANLSMELKNLTDGGRVFSYSDPNLTAGKTLTINAETGTVELDGDNTINNFTGTFLSVLFGDNVFQYTGGKCVITISFPKRWL